MSKLWSDRSMKIVLDGQNLDLAEHGRVGQTREGYQAIMPHESLFRENLPHFDRPQAHRDHLRALATRASQRAGQDLTRLCRVEKTDSARAIFSRVTLFIVVKEKKNLLRLATPRSRTVYPEP